MVNEESAKLMPPNSFFVQIRNCVLAVACGAFSNALIAAPEESIRQSEGDDIAVNLGRSDRAEVAKGVSFLEGVDAARKRTQEVLGLDYGVTYHSIFAASLLGDS